MPEKRNPSPISRALLLLLILTLAGIASAQTPEVFASGLLSPTKMLRTPAGNLLVSEAGEGLNSGRISIVDSSGTRRTLLDGLPSGTDVTGGSLGPSGLALRGETLFIAISGGNGARFGDAPGTEVPNPDGPASPILSSVIEVRISPGVDSLAGEFALDLAAHFELADGFELSVEDGSGSEAAIRLVTDFRDIVPDPQVNIRLSQPYGVALAPEDSDTLYVIDAGLNKLVRVSISTGRWQRVAAFPPFPNPAPGPPVMDAVPNSVRVYGGQLLVTALTGFPFAPSASWTFWVDPASGEFGPFIAGLSTPIDVLFRNRDGGVEFFVLEFSADLNAGAPGRLLFYDSPLGEVLLEGLITPTSMVEDPASGDLFVSEYGPGRILRVTTP